MASRSCPPTLRYDDRALQGRVGRLVVVVKPAGADRPHGGRPALARIQKPNSLEFRTIRVYRMRVRRHVMRRARVVDEGHLATGRNRQRLRAHTRRRDGERRTVRRTASACCPGLRRRGINRRTGPSAAARAAKQCGTCSSARHLPLTPVHDQGCLTTRRPRISPPAFAWLCTLT